MTARAAAGESTPRPEARGARALRLARLPVAFLGGALTLTLALFQVHDRLWPPATVHGGEVVAADVVQLGVSYGRYVHEHPLLYPNPKATLRHAGSLENRPGAVVDVVLRMEGLRGRSCRAEYTVYRTPLRVVLGPKESLAHCTANVQDGDEGGWPAWVELPPVRRDARGRPLTQHLFVRFDLYDERGLFLGPGKDTQVVAWDGTAG